jgi:putative ABC transport system permease protein
MLRTDIQYAFRMMRKSPVFTIVVILTIALAIGANTAIFSVVNTVLLRPMPFSRPDRLMQVAERNDKLNLPTFSASVLNFLSWREQTKTLQEMAAIGFGTYTISGGGEPEQLAGNKISPSLMHVLGISPVAGRTFTEDEQKPGAPSVAMLGEGLWKRRFGSDPTIVGRTIILNGAAVTVVGIAPSAMTILTGGDVYTPLILDPPKEIRLNHVLFVVGRLRDGISIQQAQAEMDSISGGVGTQYPEVRDWGIRLVSLFDTFVSTQLKTGLWVLLGAVGFVLLIACANIANMLLARAAARQREMAVRTALGASHRRLLSQSLTESVSLSIIGGVLGIATALWLVRMMNHILPPNLLPVPEIHADIYVMLFAVALTVMTGLLFGIVPAWRMSKADINDVLKFAGRGSGGSMRASLRNGLAAVELAFATILLIGAGLLIQSFAQLQRVRTGFDSSHLMTFELAPPPVKYPPDGHAQMFYRELLDTLVAMPGVRGAAVSSGIPFGAGSQTRSPFATTGDSVLPPETAVPVDWRVVSPGFFKTMSIPLLRGRDFTDSDGADPPPMIVSRATAKRFWGDGDPIGRTIHRPSDRKQYMVVGVVDDVRNAALTQESPTLYWPLASRAFPLMDIVVRADGSPESLMPVIRQKVHDIDAELALANVRTMDEWLSNSTAQPRLSSALTGIFAVAAVMIAAIGIYGVLAYSVNQRTPEIGLRMALGARPSGVLRLIVGEGMAIALVGTGAGLAGGYGLGQALSSIVYGVSVHDGFTFVSVAVLLIIVALVACAIPARRASRIDPLVALRQET